MVKTKPIADVTPESLDEHTAVVHNGKMIVFGGFNDGYRTNQVHSMDLSTFAWDCIKAEGD